METQPNPSVSDPTASTSPPTSEGPGIGLPPWSSALAIRIVSVFGGALVLTAAIAGAASRWGSVSVTVRLLALGAVLVAVATAAEMLEGKLEILGRVLSHLAAALVLPVAVITTAQLGGSWRSCTLVGGVVGAVALEAQGRRRRAPLLHGSTAIAAVVGCAGLAALLDQPTAVFIGVVALGAAAIGSVKRATVLATSAIVAPAVGVLTTYQIGSGTLVELGLTGNRALTGASIGGALTAATFALLWYRHRSIVFAAATVSALTFSGIATLVSFELRPDAPLVAMITLVAVEVFAAFRYGLVTAWRPASRDGGGAKGAALRLGVDLAEIMSVLAVAATIDRRFNVVALLAGVALFIGAVRRREVFGHRLPAAITALWFGIAIANTAPSFVFAAVIATTLAVVSLLHCDKELANVASLATVATVVSYLLERSVDRLSAAAILGALGVVALAANALLGRRVDPLAVFGVACLASAPWFVPEHVELAAIGASFVVLVFALVMRFRALAVGALGTGHAAAYALATNEALSSNWRALVVVVGAAMLEETVRRLGFRWKGPRQTLSLACATTYLLVNPGLVDRLVFMVVGGIVLAGIGAVARHRPALWCGVLITSAALFVASSPTLSELPVWAWALSGGLALLGLGAVLEVRKNKLADAAQQRSACGATAPSMDRGSRW